MSSLFHVPCTIPNQHHVLILWLFHFCLVYLVPVRQGLCLPLCPLPNTVLN